MLGDTAGEVVNGEFLGSCSSLPTPETGEKA